VPLSSFSFVIPRGPQPRLRGKHVQGICSLAVFQQTVRRVALSFGQRIDITTIGDIHHAQKVD
jgi:hypothetical protein